MKAITDTYERARALYENGMAQAALELLEFQLAERPQDAPSIELKGIIYHSIRDFGHARGELETAGLIRPLTSSGQLALADAYWFTGKKNVSLKLYEHLRNRNAIHHSLLSGLAMGFGRAKRFHEAIAICRRAFDEAPTCHHARYGVAYYMSKAGYPPELIYSVIRGVAELAPGIFHYRMAVATVLCRMKRTARAYLAIADASVDELNSVTCRFCLKRLAELYSSNSDKRRLFLCERRLKKAKDQCQGRTP